MHVPWLGVAVPVYVVATNLGGALTSAGVCLARGAVPSNARAAVGWGFVAGLLNAATFVSLASALVAGNASTVYAVSALAIVVPTTWSAIVDRRRWTVVEMAMTALAVAAAIVLAA